MNECTGDWNITSARLDKSPNVDHVIGVIHVNNHNGASITGEFRPQVGQPVPLIDGKCHPIPNQQRALSFHIEIGGETLAFRGVIDPGSPNVIVCGTFVIVIGPPDPGDTGSWEATKGGFTPGKGRGAKKGGARAKERKK